MREQHGREQVDLEDLREVLAAAFAQRPAMVDTGVVDQHVEPAPTLQAAVDKLGAKRASFVALDVADRDALYDLPRQVLERWGRLDLLVNNAGVNHRGPLHERSSRQVAQILDVNLLAPVLLTQAALPHLERGGAVLNVASLAGKVPVPHEATYSASKAGLRAFSRALDTELAERGVRVLTVCPGPIDTGFLADLDNVPELVFSQPMSSALEVADAGMHALDNGVQEVDVPPRSGKLATLGYLFPTMMTALQPVLKRQGARNKRLYAKRHPAR